MRKNSPSWVADPTLAWVIAVQARLREPVTTDRLHAGLVSTGHASRVTRADPTSPTGGQGSAGQGDAPEGERPELSPQDGSRPLTAQEAERLLAAIGQGEKEDLRDALAELAARPRRGENPERDW